MADNTSQIAALRAAIASGVKSVSWNGVATSFRSLDEMRQALADLIKDDDTLGATAPKRFGSINLGNRGLS